MTEYRDSASDSVVKSLQVMLPEAESFRRFRTRVGNFRFQISAYHIEPFWM